MKRYFSLILAIAATVSGQIVPSTGNVRGPTSATDNAVARYDGTTGKLIQNSGVTIDDNGNLTAAGDIIFATNNTFLKGKTSGGSSVNLLSLTSDTNNLTRFIAGVDAGGFQWTNQAQSSAWLALNSSGLFTSLNITAGSATTPKGKIDAQGTYDGSAPSTSSTPIIRANNGGAISLWVGGNAYSNMWMQAIQDDGSNNIKNINFQPLGGDVYFGGNATFAGTGVFGTSIGTAGTQLSALKDQNAATRMGAGNQNSGASALSGLDLSSYGGSWQVDVPASTTFVNPLIFKFNGNERARLTSGGQLTLYTTTPPAWDAAAFNVLIAGSNAFGGTNTGSNNLIVASNTYYDGSVFKYATTGYATAYRQLVGEHYFYVAASGTAGNTTSLTTSLTIKQGGTLRFDQYGAGTLTTDSSGNITATSDERAKNITGTFNKGLAEVVKLTPKRYTWKPETGLNTTDEVASLTAQDLIAAGIPEAVSTYRTVADLNDDGTPKLDADGKPLTKRIDATYTVSDRTVIAALVNAVKELNAKVAALEAARK